MSEPRPPSGPPPVSAGRWAWEWLKVLSVALLFVLLVRAFLVEAFKIPTSSMEETLLVGDFLLVNKVVYGAVIPTTGIHLPGFSEPGRGDVIVFFPPHEPEKNYVKRVVAVAGDTVGMRGKVLLLDGEPREEPYARHSDPITDPADPRMMWQLHYLASDPREWREYRPSRDNWGPLVVPDGKLFVLGDNRDNSDDSRYWGFVRVEDVKGRPLFVYYSFQQELNDPFAWLSGVRWGRIGDRVR
ncbi:MAG: signal peptidase I [Longimicrobiaceae bacterium]